MASFFIDRPVTTGCLTILVATFCLNFVIADCTNTLALVIVNTLIADKQIWNIVTCQFYEKSIIKLLFDLAGIIIITKSTRIIGGYKQFGLFFAVSLFCCSFFTTVYCFIRFFSTGIEDMIMEPIYGFAGVFMIMLTYGRQQLQNEPVFVQLPSINYNNLPVIVVSVQLILWLVGLKILALDLPFSIISMLVSWSYLRFFYKFESNSTTLGDRSDSFAFVAMFPEALHLIVIPMSTAFYNLVAMTGIFPELEVQADKPKYSHHLRHDTPEVTATVIGPIRNADVVQDRRRAKALKLLDAKMAELNGESDGWDVKDSDDVEAPIRVEESTVRV